MSPSDYTANVVAQFGSFTQSPLAKLTVGQLLLLLTVATGWMIISNHITGEL